MAVTAIFVVRLFYLQVIKHDYYHNAALASQLKEYEIPAERGLIYAQDGSSVTPLVLNETKYTLFADPKYIKDPEKESVAIAKIIQGDAAKIAEQLKTSNTRYVILAKELNKTQRDEIDKLEFAGIGTRDAVYRTYPQGNLASQVLGFVNDEGKGQYGIEQALNNNLSGAPGQLKAITDARGVPLVSNRDNVMADAKPGESVVLTIDIGMQRQVEELLKARLDQSKSKSGSVIVMDPNSGAIKAMANYPTYDPMKLHEIEDLSVLSNASVSQAFEVGSIVKSLTAAAALDKGTLTTNSSFYDEGFVQVGDRKITDVGNSVGTQTVESTLVHSFNTGAVWMLKSLGGGNLNLQSRTTWHEYLTNHYRLGSATGIEQTGEGTGYIPGPEDTGTGIQVTYANMAFGQGMTATILQMGAAFSSIINGGTYYQPQLVAGYRTPDGKVADKKPVILNDATVSSSVSVEMRSLLSRVIEKNLPSIVRSGYQIGGKTGTAEVARPEGGYMSDRYNGTYVGFVGGDKPEYVIITKVDVPEIPGNAGYTSAMPLFRDVTNMLIDNFGVTPKKR